MQKKIITLIFILSFLISPVFADKQDPLLEIPKDTVPGHKSINKYGHNDNVGAALDTIWSNETLYVYPPTAETLNVSSSDADDTPGDTGAWNITILGLDANYVEINETLQLNGQIPVTTTNSYLRVYRAYVLESGTSGTNEGAIWIYNTTLLAMIDAGFGQTLMAVYTIPANYTGYLTNYRITSDTDKSVSTALIFDYFGGSRRYQSHIHLYRQIFVSEYMPYKPIPARTDIMLVAQVSPAGGAVSGEFDLILVADGSNNINQTVIVEQPVDVNIVESIDLMSTEFFVFILIAMTTMYIAWNTENNRNAGLGFAFSTLFWIATMYQWALDTVGTQSFNLMWLYLAPMTFCIVMFSEKSWHQMDDATENVSKGRKRY